MIEYVRWETRWDNTFLQLHHTLLFSIPKTLACFSEAMKLTPHSYFVPWGPRRSNQESGQLHCCWLVHRASNVIVVALSKQDCRCHVLMRLKETTNKQTVARSNRKRNQPSKWFQRTPETLLLPFCIAVLRSVVAFHTQFYYILLGSLSPLFDDFLLAELQWNANFAQFRSQFWNTTSRLSTEECQVCLVTKLVRNQDSLFPFLGFFILGLRKPKLILLMRIQRMHSDMDCSWE